MILTLLPVLFILTAAKPQTAPIGDKAADLDGLVKEIADSTAKPKAIQEEDEPCITKTGAQGVCVTYFLCSEMGHYNDDGSSLIDVKSPKGSIKPKNSEGTDMAGSLDIRAKRDTRGNKEENNPCSNYLQVCCVITNSTREEEVTPILPATEQQKSCRWHNREGLKKITSSDDGYANFAELPWMTALLKVETVSDEKLNVFIGGGSLIHPNVILTAAHFFADNDNDTYKVRAGQWDTQSIKEQLPHQDRNVVKIVTRKDFSRSALRNDVALLFLDSPMTLAANVAPICLPTSGEVIPSGSRCFASGWGKNNFNNKARYQTLLKKVELPMVDHTTCQESLRTTRLGKRFKLHSSFLCAGGDKDKDTCTGDGGSPLVCPAESGENGYVQAGIVAWGIGCGREGIPGVYVDVAKFRSWIDEKMAAEGYSLTE